MVFNHRYKKKSLLFQCYFQINISSFSYYVIKIQVIKYYLNLFRKGCAEHHGVSDAFVWHCVLFNNASDLRFKSHIQHSIRLIQDEVAVEKRTDGQGWSQKLKRLFLSDK